jgi:hypothetical protein
MAGGVLKGFGIPLIVLGILLMVAGIAAAAYGAYQMQEDQDRLVPRNDPDEAQALAVAGGLGFAAGLVLLVAGLVLNAAGNGRRHRELLQAAAGRPAAAAPPASPAPVVPAAPKTPAALPPPASKKGAVVAVVCLGALTLAVLGLVALGDGSRAAAGLGGHPPAFQPLDFDGAVRNAFSVPVAGAATADTADSQRAFDAPEGARSMRVELAWDRAGAGADALEILVEAPDGSGWTELGRASGGAPVVLDLPLDGASHLRYRVFPAGDGAVAEQPFHVHVSFA